MYSKLTKQVSFQKYWYIIDYLLKRDSRVRIFVDLNQNSFGFINRLNIKPLTFITTLVELYLWMWLNKVNPFKVKIVYNADKISKDDVFFAFSFENLNVKEHKMNYLKETRFLKIIHLTHYMLNTSYLSANAKDTSVDFFAAENNLKNMPYFAEHFTHYNKNVYLLPHVYKRRFVNKKEFISRLNRCLATGTFHDLPDMEELKDFKKHFKVNTYHPMRKEIFLNKEKLEGLIDSSISHLNSEIKLKDSGRKNNIIMKLYLKIWNNFHSRQSQYFNFNIVDRYNEYKMFVVPEEIHGLPGIGFVEGMACGSAYLGIDSSMYRDIGLIPEKHYIAYDNTIEGLIDKIKYYQLHGDELEKIAWRGCEYVREHFNGEKVAAGFIGDIEHLSAKYAANDYSADGLEFESSFTNTIKNGDHI